MSASQEIPCRSGLLPFPEVWPSETTPQDHFSPVEMADLTVLIMVINGWNRFVIAFRAHLE